MLSLNLNKKRDCSQSRVVYMMYNPRQGNLLIPALSLPVQEDLNGVNRELSNGLKFNRQPRKMLFFYLQPSKVQTKINRPKVSRNSKSHILSWCSRTSGSWTNSKVKKPVPKFSKTLFRGIAGLAKPYSLLISENISNLCKCKENS